MGSTSIGPARCQAMTGQGKPCQNTANDSGFCWWHDPATAGERLAAQSKGGAARHGRQIGSQTPQNGADGPITLRTASDVLALVERAANDALRMEPSLARARTLASLAEKAVKVIDAVQAERRADHFAAVYRGAADPLALPSFAYDDIDEWETD